MSDATVGISIGVPDAVRAWNADPTRMTKNCAKLFDKKIMVASSRIWFPKTASKIIRSRLSIEALRYGLLTSVNKEHRQAAEWEGVPPLCEYASSRELFGLELPERYYPVGGVGFKIKGTDFVRSQTRQERFAIAIQCRMSPLTVEQARMWLSILNFELCVDPALKPITAIILDFGRRRDGVTMFEWSKENVELLTKEELDSRLCTLAAMLVAAKSAAPLPAPKPKMRTGDSSPGLFD